MTTATSSSAAPAGYHTIMPYLTLADTSAALAFYEKAFGAVTRMRMDMPDGKVAHAELMIGDMALMLGGECPEMATVKHPQSLGGTSVAIHLYVDDVDAFVQKAVDAGATLVKAPKDQFYGDRCGSIADPFGHVWYVATHVETLTPEELKKRSEAACSAL